jgi:predicted metal-dependent phosphoesterase TrpH
MELSCHLDGRSLHLPAYLFDPAHPGLAAETASIRDDRVRRARAVVARLAALGAGVTWECGCHSWPAARCFHAGRLSALSGYGIFPAHVLSVTAVTAAHFAGGE